MDAFLSDPLVLPVLVAAIVGSTVECFMRPFAFHGKIPNWVIAIVQMAAVVLNIAYFGGHLGGG